MSQPDFLYELFEDFMDDPANQDFSMNNGLVCRWMTGQAKISPYHPPESSSTDGIEVDYYKKLFQTIENIVELIGKDDIPKYLLFLENAFPYMDNYNYQKGMKEIIQELKRLLKNGIILRRTNCPPVIFYFLQLL